MDVTILVGTFGSSQWEDLARNRAIPSAMEQGVPVIHRHAASLMEARNACLNAARSEFVIHLDADDELEPGYVDTLSRGTADIRVPSVRYVRGRVYHTPRMPKVSGHSHICSSECLPYGNWIVVGAMARRSILTSIGGWRDYEWSEDWDLWLRCHLQGAVIEAIPSAVYRAHTRPGSRNHAGTATTRLEVHRQIARDNGVPIP